MSMSPPSVASRQIAGSNGFGHSMEIVSQSYLLSSYSEIDIQVQDSSINQDPPLPVYLKLEAYPGQKGREQALAMKFLLTLHCFYLMSQLQALIPPQQTNSFSLFKD
ncbi:hypothetical protein TSUD_324660 [Trifolium subterraneum]|uniref:Uncharacterized protein n=1 Tax=Trifolium subterraneum TaxID=3900 RepID=A0A2Z6NF18_TRISU|nr:hypothetical protein TSUD_324660 [Trifolium subterraneum]